MYKARHSPQFLELGDISALEDDDWIMVSHEPIEAVEVKEDKPEVIEEKVEVKEDKPEAIEEKVEVKEDKSENPPTTTYQPNYHKKGQGKWGKAGKP
jgi:hypothetical protein